MGRYINPANIPLSVAVYLANDTYDHESDTISATAFLKPLRQLILSQRLPEDMSLIDIMTLTKSREGTAVHDAIESAWLHNKEGALKALGYPQQVIDRIVVNPDPKEVTEDQIPIYMERRSYRELIGYTVSGKFDFVAEGRIEDFKKTGVFTWQNNTKDEDYVLQGSIYRWLNPDIVTQDEMQINFLFSDWQAFRVAAESNYPSHPIMYKRYKLLSEQQIEAFMKRKLTQLEQYKDAPEEKLPLCTDKELWRKEPEFKYYKNPAKMSRSTKNFKPSEFGSENAARTAAYSRASKDKHVGTVVEVPGQVMACKYCPAFPLCSQKDALIADGSLKL